MFKKSRIAVAALSVIGLGMAMAGTASAATPATTTGPFFNPLGPTHCKSSASGQTSGRISTTVSGGEVRTEAGYFRTATVVVGDELLKSIDGNWYDTGIGLTHSGVLGPGHVQGGYVTANWKFKKSPHIDPRFGLRALTSGRYELAVTATAYNQDGIEFWTQSQLSDVCTFQH